MVDSVPASCVTGAEKKCYSNVHGSRLGVDHGRARPQKDSWSVEGGHCSWRGGRSLRQRKRVQSLDKSLWLPLGEDEDGVGSSSASAHEVRLPWMNWYAGVRRVMRHFDRAGSRMPSGLHHVLRGGAERMTGPKEELRRLEYEMQMLSIYDP